MNDDEARQWNFQLNIVGLTLLLFAAGYIGQHLALLMPVSGWGPVAAHYLGELVLTIVAVITALSRAYGSLSQQRHRIAWLGTVFKILLEDFTRIEPVFRSSQSSRG